jgi:hypothetical protein
MLYRPPGKGQPRNLEEPDDRARFSCVDWHSESPYGERHSAPSGFAEGLLIEWADATKAYPVRVFGRQSGASGCADAPDGFPKPAFGGADRPKPFVSHKFAA